jgi:hypothetical protein
MALELRQQSGDPGATLIARFVELGHGRVGHGTLVNHFVDVESEPHRAALAQAMTKNLGAGPRHRRRLRRQPPQDVWCRGFRRVNEAQAEETLIECWWPYYEPEFGQAN